MTPVLYIGHLHGSPSILKAHFLSHFDLGEHLPILIAFGVYCKELFLP